MTRLVLRALCFSLGKLPRAWTLALGALFGWFVHAIVRVRQSHVREALARANIRLAESAVLVALGRSLFELLGIYGRAPSAALPLEFSPEFADQLRVLSTRPFVIATAHCGQFEASAYLLARERVTSVIVTRQGMASVEAFLNDQRNARGVTPLSAPAPVLQLAARALDAGNVVCAVIDQVPARLVGSVRTHFLGGEVYVDPTPFVLAARAQVPVLLVATTRGDVGSSLRLLARLDPPRAGRSAWARTAAVQATALLEKHIRQHPGEWMWLHRRWRAPKG